MCYASLKILVFSQIYKIPSPSYQEFHKIPRMFREFMKSLSETVIL